MARVEIEQQISFFSFSFACVSEARHMIWQECELEKDIGNNNPPDLDCKPKLFHKQMLGKHYEVVYGGHIKLSLADLESAKEENLERLKETQKKCLGQKNKEREEWQLNEEWK